MQLLEHFKELSIYPKNAKELKGLILQLAVQGKLTQAFRDRHPELVSGSQSAKALLASIKVEKEQLIKEKKIKKEKPFPAIVADEIPFELPEGWEWCRLNDISSINGGFAFKSSQYIDEGVRVIRISDFDEDGLKNAKIVRYEYTDDLEVYRLEIHNIIMAMTGGTVGKSFFINSIEEPMVTNQRVATIKLIQPVYEAYVNCVVPTRLIQDVIAEAKNSTNDNISMSDIKGFYIPLPPLPEQRAIVETVNTLFKEVEALEKLTAERVQLKEDFITSALRELSTGDTQKEWVFLQKHFSAFMNEESNIKKLRETILQLAVQGKLTQAFRDRHPELATGSHSAKALLASIKAEKEQLIKDKKIKKEKPLPAITDDEIPYDLPEGWAWCRLKELGLITGGGTPSKGKATYWGGNILWVSPKDMKFEYITDSQDKVTIEGIQNSSAKLIPEGSLLVVGRSGILKRTIPISINNVECTVNQDMKVIVPYIKAMNIFIRLVLKGMEMRLLKHFVKYGMTVHSLKYSEFELLSFPLPPLSEQHAIVEKVNILMALCDELEKQVIASKANAEKLMQSVLREVFQPNTDFNQGKAAPKPYPVVEDELILAAES